MQHRIVMSAIAATLILAASSIFAQGKPADAADEPAMRPQSAPSPMMDRSATGSRPGRANQGISDQAPVPRDPADNAAEEAFLQGQNSMHSESRNQAAESKSSNRNEAAEQKEENRDEAAERKDENRDSRANLRSENADDNGQR